MKKNILFFLAAVLIPGLCQTVSLAGETEVLIEKLVEKDVLTPLEAQIILDETRETAAKQMAQGTYSSLPAWVQNLQFKGDLRLRYQWNKKKGSTERNRGRYRLRLGFDSKVNDDVKVFFGLASGGSDPRSTNQTFTNNFETPDIRLDYAFAEYMAMPGLSFYGGKFTRKTVIWEPGDLLWDSDINPEGAAMVLAKPVSPGLDLFLNSAALVLDESGSDPSDPMMYCVQPGFEMGFNGISVKGAVAYYGFGSVKGAALDYSEGSNTVDSSGNLVYDYSSVSPAVEIGLSNPAGGIVPYLAFFGEYIHNPDPSDKNNGYLVGLLFGEKKVKKPNQWQVKYMYRKLEKDAWLDTYPDSDFYGGATGVKGHEVILEYALKENVTVGLDYYHSANIDGVEKTENILQVDTKLKF